jgi:serine/threonine protein kinase
MGATDTLPPELADHPDYEVVRELGRGGMGVVYLVRNKLMGRLEVLKVVGGHLVERPGVRDRFLREVQSAAKLQHKNIVTAYAAMRMGASIVLAMEYVNGEDLAQMVKSRGPLPVTNACYFIYQAALGLQHAHERGMVHRDIKPANLIFAIEGKKGVVKVLDFGLAKVTGEGQADSGLTREGQMLGTPDFIAPEQIRDAQSADIRADIYSLGCTFYYLLTGGPPFRGEQLWDVYQAHFSMDAGPLNLVRPEVPVELAAVVARMMAKDPRARFQTPGDVAQALVPFLKKGSAAPESPTTNVSQVGKMNTNRSLPADVSRLTLPATATEDVVQAREAAERPIAVSQWESLIELGNSASSTATVPTLAKSRQVRHQRPPWVWAAVVAAALLGLACAFGVIIKLRIEDGALLIVEVSEPGADITVDKQHVAITWDASRKRAEIKALPGEHMVEVTKDGFTAKGMNVAVSEAGREIVKAVLQPSEPEVVKVNTKQVALQAPVVSAPAPPAPAVRTKRYPVRIVWSAWGMSGSDLVNKRKGSHSMVLLARDVSLRDFTFEAEVSRIEGSGSVELHIGDKNFITFGFEGKNNQVKTFMKHFEGGAARKSPKPLPMDPVDENTWIHLRVEKKGATTVYYLNHKELFRERNDQMERGVLAVATVGANAKFRNIHATGAGGIALLEGLPDLPKMEEWRLKSGGDDPR